MASIFFKVCNNCEAFYYMQEFKCPVCGSRKFYVDGVEVRVYQEKSAENDKQEPDPETPSDTQADQDCADQPTPYDP